MDMTEHYKVTASAIFFLGFGFKKKKEPWTLFTGENASIYWSLENKLLNQSLHSQHRMWKESYWSRAARQMKNKQCKWIRKPLLM